MLRLRRVAALVLLILELAAVAPLVAGGDSGGVVVVRFVSPMGDGSGWRVEARVGWLNCSGVVGVNPGYLEARAISRGLVVLPLYYVLASVCPSLGLVDALDRLGDAASVRVVVEAPEGYVARSGLDWRGYGPPGGPYVVPGMLLHRYYLYDGVVIAASTRYRVYDFPRANLSLIVYKGFRGAEPGVLASAVVAARRAGTGILGSSPRSPVVAVLSSPKEFPLLAPGTAYSLGAVFLVDDRLVSTPPGWYIHVFAHEALHGWINDGLVYGDFSFEEAVVEFTALRGLYLYNRSLYRLAAPYAGEGVDSGEPYAVWARVHALLWALSLQVCGRDAYSAALHRVFREALNSSQPRIYSVIDLLGYINETCGLRVLEAWGALLPAVEELNITTLLENPDAVHPPKAPACQEATQGGKHPSSTEPIATATRPQSREASGSTGTDVAANATATQGMAEAETMGEAVAATGQSPCRCSGGPSGGTAGGLLALAALGAAAAAIVALRRRG